MFPLAQVVITDLVTQLLAAANQKNWWLVGVLAVIGLVAAIRKLAAYTDKLKFFLTDRGGAILALAAGIAGSLVTAAVSGGINLQTLLNGVILGVTSAGGYNVVKKIFTSPPAVVQ
jgi:hypothetical protein